MVFPTIEQHKKVNNLFLLELESKPNNLANILPNIEIDQNMTNPDSRDNKKTHFIDTVLDKQPQTKILHSKAIIKDLLNRTRKILNKYFINDKKKEWQEHAQAALKEI